MLEVIVIEKTRSKEIMGKTGEKNKMTRRKAKQIKKAKELDDLFSNSDNYNWGD